MTSKKAGNNPASQVQIRVSVDPHMGPIYAHLASIPSTLRSRELIALARAGMLLAGAPVLSLSSGGPAAGARAGVPRDVEGPGPVVRAADPAMGELDHLVGFAESSPPLH